MLFLRYGIILVFSSTLFAGECSNYHQTRQPFFGELHLHTQYSADAATLDTRNTPRDAYRFAKGYVVGLPPYVDTRISDTDSANPPINGVAQHPYCLPPEKCEFTATRIAQLPATRALDFAAITDHAEMIGETNICWFEGGAQCSDDTDCKTEGQFCSALAGNTCVPEGYNSQSCILGRDDVSRLRNGAGATLFAAAYVGLEFPVRLPFCKDTGPKKGNCVFQEQNVWQQIQSAAAEANNPCNFTSFVAYEYTSDPGMGACEANTETMTEGSGKACYVDGDCPETAPKCGTSQNGFSNLHRNIIFKTDQVPNLPVTNVDVIVGCGNGSAADSSTKDCQGYTGPKNDFPAGTFSSSNGVALGSPQIMLKNLASQCNDLNNCDFISIPHNSNLSGGAMFMIPQSDLDASIRKKFEPLVEIIQIKGSSECRYSPERIWGTADEFCSFESMNFGRLTGSFIKEPNAVNIQPNSFIRNVLKDGLKYAQLKGKNPFQLGFVGATDNHNGTPSDTNASSYAKHGGHGDQGWAESGVALNETDQLGLETNGGGVTGVWAEENTRGALFAALKRRETFATSGTRQTVRMFGGFMIPADICSKPDFAAQGYAKGVPMGGDLNNPGNSLAPSFVVAANMDPGWPGHPGTKLERIQIIKGWVDVRGQTHEVVYNVAGNSKSASVNRGHGSLCAVWKDPQFNKKEQAFYYARVLEIPSWRWNQYYCSTRGVNCNVPSSAKKDISPYTEWEYQQCCSNLVPKTVQQRAWGSPIWYTP